jgi:hypothetical protein
VGEEEGGAGVATYLYVPLELGRRRRRRGHAARDVETDSLRRTIDIPSTLSRFWHQPGNDPIKPGKVLFWVNTTRFE